MKKCHAYIKCDIKIDMLIIFRNKIFALSCSLRSGGFSVWRNKFKCWCDYFGNHCQNSRGLVFVEIDV